MGSAIQELAERIMNGGAVNSAQALRLAKVGNAAVYDLFYGADRIRKKFRGDGVAFCAVINARSGRCPMDCAFCAQSGVHGAAPQEYPLVAEKRAVKAARMMKRYKVSGFGIVTSGARLSAGDFKAVLGMVKEIKKTGLRPCASLGLIDVKRAKELKRAGLWRYHHNLEAAASFYPRICTTQKYERKLATVRAVKQAGLRACCGGIFGLGESWKQRIEMAMTLKELDVDAVPLNFLNPVKGTPLGKRKRLPPLEALKIIALYRFLLPDKELKVCGGREVVLGEFQPLMYLAGADGTMVGDYLTTAGRAAGEDIKMVKALGLRIRNGESAFATAAADKSAKRRWGER